MPFAFSMKRIVLAVIVGAAVELTGMPPYAYAIVGDVPAMPPVEHPNSVTGNGVLADMTGGSLTGSGSPPATTEPPALLSGLLGLGLIGAYELICRGIANS